MKKVSVIFMSVFLIGCGAAMIGGTRGDYYEGRIGQSVDEFEGYSSTFVNLAMPSFSYMAEITLRFEKVSRKNKPTTYVMSSYLYQDDWLFVKKLKIKLDDKMYEFDSVKDSRNVLNGGYIEELNYYAVDRDFIEKMANAATVSIRLVGKDNYMVMDYKDKHSDLLKNFLIQTK